jgi:hypothetical protein
VSDGNAAHGSSASMMSSQVKLLITFNAFCIVQRATAQSRAGNSHSNGVAKAPPVFKPAGLAVCTFFSFVIRFSRLSGISE